MALNMVSKIINKINILWMKVLIGMIIVELEPILLI